MYSYQTFSSGQVLTAAEVQQLEVNVRDHEHGRSPSVAKIHAMASKSADYSAQVSDYGTLFIFSASATLTLPDPATAGPAWFCEVYADGDGVIVTISGTGLPTYTRVFKGQWVRVYSTGAAYIAGTSQFNEVLVTQQTANASASLDFPLDADGDADIHRFELHQIVPATDAIEFALRVSVDGGATFASASYRFTYGIATDASGHSASGSTSFGFMRLFQNLGTAAGESLSGMVYLFRSYDTTKYKQFAWFGGCYNSTPQQQAFFGSGVYVGALGAITDVQFLMESGNIASGQISHYKMRAASLLVP